LQFTQDAIDALELILPALDPVVASMAEEKVPDGCHQLTSSEDMLEKLLQGRKPVEMAAQKISLEDRVIKLQSLIFAAEGVPLAVQALEKQLEEAQAELSTLASTKKGHTEKSQLCALQQVLTDFRAEVQGREDVRTKAQEKTGLRQQERRKHFQLLREQLHYALADMEIVEEAAGAAYALLEEDTATRDAEVVTQLEQMVSDLLPSVNAASVDPSAKSAEEAAEAEKAASEQAKAEAEAHFAAAAAADIVKAQEERSDLLNKMASLQQMVDEQAKKQEERKQNAKRLTDMKAAFEATIPNVTLADLPELEVPKGTALAKQGQLHWLLSNWHANGMKSAFTLGDLVKHTTLGKEAPDFIMKVLGTKWVEWFPLQPLGSAIMPRQAAELIHQSLERLAGSWEKANQAQKTQEAARDSYAAMAGEAKRRRAEIKDAAME
jgi:hypothetical protein